MNQAPAVLSISPHPDDELLGAPATLMALRDSGWRVVNLACSLGRTEDRERRRAELSEACRRAGFDLAIPDGIPPIGPDDDLAVAQTALATVIAETAAQIGATLLAGPSPHDAHHGHEVVGRAIRDAVQMRGEPQRVIFWGLWSDLAMPNVLVRFDAARLAEIQRALAAHAGELARNRFEQLLAARAAANAVLGPERVFGYGAAGTPDDQDAFAELLTDTRWSPGAGWRLASPRELDRSRPLTPWPAALPDHGIEIGWWLDAPSVSTRVRDARRVKRLG
jgi:LmbE family N-acetylglucosaminyl deacetylase